MLPTQDGCQVPVNSIFFTDKNITVLLLTNSMLRQRFFQWPSGYGKYVRVEQD